MITTRYRLSFPFFLLLLNRLFLNSPLLMLMCLGSLLFDAYSVSSLPPPHPPFFCFVLVSFVVVLGMMLLKAMG